MIAGKTNDNTLWLEINDKPLAAYICAMGPDGRVRIKTIDGVWVCKFSNIERTRELMDLYYQGGGGAKMSEMERFCESYYEATRRLEQSTCISRIVEQVAY